VDIINEYIKKHQEIELDKTGYIHPVPAIQCNDGFSVSVQASHFAYCTPRENGAFPYCSFELGYPSEADLLIAAYAEDAFNLTATVYGWVPLEIVLQLVEKHGGMKTDDQK